MIKQGIRVNAVNPGLIDTQVGRDVFKGDEQVHAGTAEQVPNGRAGRPEEIVQRTTDLPTGPPAAVPMRAPYPSVGYIHPSRPRLAALCETPQPLFSLDHAESLYRTKRPHSPTLPQGD